MTQLEQAIAKSQEVFDLVTGKFKVWDNQVKAQIAKLEAWKNSIIPELRVGWLFFEDKKHSITTNDGGGNFNIRIGASPGAEPVTTEAGRPGTITFDQTKGKYLFLSSDEDKEVGEKADMKPILWFDHSAIYKDGKEIPCTEKTNGQNASLHFVNGMMIVRGTVTAKSGDVFNFPVAFPSACFQAFGNHNGDQLKLIQIQLVSKTQFRVRHENSNAINVHYVAFGQ